VYFLEDVSLTLQNSPLCLVLSQFKPVQTNSVKRTGSCTAYSKSDMTPRCLLPLYMECDTID